MSTEYRVVWQRKGQVGKTSRIYESRESAERHRVLLMLRRMPWPPLVEIRVESREASDWGAA